MRQFFSRCTQGTVQRDLLLALQFPQDEGLLCGHSLTPGASVDSQAPLEVQGAGCNIP